MGQKAPAPRRTDHADGRTRQGQNAASAARARPTRRAATPRAPGVHRAGTRDEAPRSRTLHRTGGRGLGPLAACWFHAGTGLLCPFCGTLRGVAALSNGDPLTALHDNAPVMLLLGVATLVWGRRLLFAATGKTVDHPNVSGGAYRALGAFFLLFTIYRNTPYGAWLAPLS